MGSPLAKASLAATKPSLALALAFKAVPKLQVVAMLVVTIGAVGVAAGLPLFSIN